MIRLLILFLLGCLVLSQESQVNSQSQTQDNERAEDNINQQYNQAQQQQTSEQLQQQESQRTQPSKTRPQSPMLRGKVQLPPMYGPEGGVSPTRMSDVRIRVSGPKGYLQATYCRPDGSFILHNVEQGSLVLDVIAHGWSFSPYRVDVSSKTGNIHISTLDLVSQSLSMPFVFVPQGKVDYFQKRTQFNPLNYLKGPYGIMAVIMIAIVFILPRMKFDPEELKQYQEQMQQAQQQVDAGVNSKKR